MAVTSTRRISWLRSKKIRQSPTRRRKAVGWLVSARTSPARGSIRMASSAAQIRSRSDLGARARSFWAGLATITCQKGAKLIEGGVGSRANCRATFLDLPKLCGCRGIASARGEVSPKRLADELGTGTVLGLPNTLHILDHLWRERNCNARTCSHSGSSGVKWYDQIIPSLRRVSST